MSRTVNITDEIIVVSKGEEDTGKMAMLGANGKFHLSVIPSIEVKQPGCRAYMTVAASLPSATWSSVPMQTIGYDTDNIHGNDPTKFTIKTPGVYLIVHQDSILSGSLSVGIRKNGVSIIAASGEAKTHGNVSSIAYLDAGDFIEPIVIQNSGATATSYITDYYCPFIAINKIGD
jgi:hypothetical protein